MLITAIQAASAQQCATLPFTSIEKNIPVGLKTAEAVEIRIVVHQLLPPDIPFFSPAAIIDQLETLNDNFQKKELALNLLPDDLQAIAATGNIRFILATTDENDDSFNGILNKRTTIASAGGDPELLISASSGSPPLPTTSFLNVYVCEISESIFGYAANPELVGRDDDIVAIDYRRFGINSQYNSSGKTLTHEIGHYLGLQHVWGQEANECENDDGLSDTPFQTAPHYGCNSFLDDCSNQLAGNNFMDYSPDCCLLYFTSQQLELMEYVLSNFRMELGKTFAAEVVDSLDVSLFLYPNPARNVLRIKFRNAPPDNISVYNSAGVLVLQNSIAKNESQAILWLNDLPAGTYSLLAVRAGQYKMERFVHIP